GGGWGGGGGGAPFFVWLAGRALGPPAPPHPNRHTKAEKRHIPPEGGVRNVSGGLLSCPPGHRSCPPGGRCRATRRPVEGPVWPLPASNQGSGFRRCRGPAPSHLSAVQD